MIQRVKDVMSSNIIAVLPSDTAIEAAKLMKEHNIGSVPVVSAGEVKGIVTDRDIILRCVADEKKADKANKTIRTISCIASLESKKNHLLCKIV